MPRTRDPNYRRFLERLRAARLEAGLGQVEVAELLGKPQSFVSKCESGERRVDVIELAAFGRIYGKTVDFFVAEESSAKLRGPGTRKRRAR